MCNRFDNQVDPRMLDEALDALIRDSYRPNKPAGEVAITDTSGVVRLREDGRPELVEMRWSWPSGPRGKPVYNYVSENRRFSSGRCLIPAAAFFEFTDPPAEAPKRSKKIRWRFTLAESPWFFIAGVWRPAAAAGADAWSMITTSPGPDIAPYHERQVVVLAPDQGERWLRGDDPALLLKPSPAGALAVVQDGP